MSYQEEDSIFAVLNVTLQVQWNPYVLIILVQ